MNSFTYLLIGYFFGAVVGAATILLAAKIHIRQHYTKRIF